DDAEVDHRADLDRDVVARDHVLRRHVERDRLHAHLHHLLDERREQHEPRPVALPARVHQRPRRASEPEDHRALVFPEHAHERADEEDHGEQHDQQDQRFDADHQAPPVLPFFTTFSVSPSTPTTRTRAPASTASPSATARQISPWIAICPSGASASRTTPVCPMSPDTPRSGRRASARIPTVMTKRKSPAVIPTVGRMTRQEIRKPSSVASKSMSEPSAIEMMPPMASTPWLTI